MSVKPVRLQLSRKKGFNLQALSRATNGLPAVSCSRPSKYGNQFRIGDPGPLGISVTGVPVGRIESVSRAHAVLLHRENWTAYILRDPDSSSRVFSELRDHNLACTCDLDEVCHVDFLLLAANR